MEQTLEENMKREFKAAYFATLAGWVVQDKSKLPIAYVNKMEAAFFEGYKLCHEFELTLSHRERFYAFSQKLQRLEDEFAHLL